MRVMICGGGTGGHIFPAIAIAQKLQERHPDTVVHFVGTRYGMETELVPKHGYPLITLPIRGFLGKSVRDKLALLWRLPASLAKSLWVLLRHRPGVVIGVGGYASGPLLLVASLLRIPTMIQEQNAFPGLTNRVGSRFARLACLGFPEAARLLRCPSVITGNPVRKGLGKLEPWSPDRNLLLILGGSQGARALNRTLPDLLRRVVPGTSLRVIHQCGARYLEEVRQAYEGAPFEVEVTPFIEDMASVFDQALLMICRSGASTIAELKQAHIPAILVPFPQAAHDHQTFNAQSLAASGAAIVISESDLADADTSVRELLEDRQKLSKMAGAYPCKSDDGATRCAEIAEALYQGREVAELVSEFGVNV